MAKKSANDTLKKIDGFCAPYALKYLTGFPDKKILDVCYANGFKQEWGMEEYEVIRAALDLGLRTRRVNLKKRDLYGVKLIRFAKEYPQGRFLVYTSGHILVVSNGVIVDPINDGYIGEERSVTSAWKINNG